MKNLVNILVFFTATLCFGQQPIEKIIEAFTVLKVYDLIEVELIKADRNKISITGYNSNNVFVSNKNGTLKIKMKFQESFDGSDTKVKLYYTDILVIDANEGATIYSAESINQLEVSLKAQEGAKINVKLNVEKAHIRAVTGANITASGKAKYQDVAIFTGGIFEGEFLLTQYTDVSIKAAGSAHVHATKNVKAKVVAGGNILVYGKPEQVEESRVLGGEIEFM